MNKSSQKKVRHCPFCNSELIDYLGRDGITENSPNRFYCSGRVVAIGLMGSQFALVVNLA